MRIVIKIITLPLIVGLFSCATASLSPGGTNVEVVFGQFTRKDCKNLGPVYGKGGGSFGGAWISDEKLMEYASNSLRNKAAEKGATHVVTATHQMGQTTGQYGGSTSTSTQSGVAYKCPKSGT